jgi:hypothetical protein
MWVNWGVRWPIRRVNFMIKRSRRDPTSPRRSPRGNGQREIQGVATRRMVLSNPYWLDFVPNRVRQSLALEINLRANVDIVG